MKNLKSKYIGDKAFYSSVIALVIPVIIQQGITNFINLLDNVMVGGLGTVSISAVAIVNQLIFVFNLTIFGGISGASIFGAQYAGKNDDEGLRQTFRFKIIFGVIVSVIAISILFFFGDTLILNFLNPDNSDPVAVLATLESAKKYLMIMLLGLVPFMLIQVYSSTLRETGETVAPMQAGVLAICTNLVLNYIFIFGHFGAPKLGVVGAAVGTIIARYLEFFYVFIFTHKNSFKFNFIKNAYKSLHINKTLVKRIIITGLPLIINETFWSIGMTMINQSYSFMGLQVVASVNITSTVSNLFRIIAVAMGTAVSIKVGQCLGTGDIKKAIDTDNKLLFFTLVLQICISIILFFTASLIPLLYNTEQEVRDISASLLKITALIIPVQALTHVIYFTLRSGGKTFITFLFDCVFTWVFPVPVSFVLSRFTGLPIVWVFLIIQSLDIIKLFIGIPILKSGYWANNVIDEKK